MKIYKMEKSVEWRICVIVSAVIAVLVLSDIFRFPASMYSNMTPITNLPQYAIQKGVPPLLGIIFILVCGTAFTRANANFKKWMNYLIKHGTRYYGTVTEVVVSSHLDKDGDTKHSYRYRVSYIDPYENIEVSFVTPVLINVNINAVGMRCDVYTAKMPASWSKFENRTDEMIEITDNSINIHPISPWKFFSIAYHNTSSVGWLGDAIAINFR